MAQDEMQQDCEHRSERRALYPPDDDPALDNSESYNLRKGKLCTGDHLGIAFR
jgi:hypothetical protein